MQDKKIKKKTGTSKLKFVYQHQYWDTSHAQLLSTSVKSLALTHLLWA